MRYEYYIAGRYLKASRKSFLSTITIISTIGVFLGVTALTAVVSVAGGFQKAYRDRVLGVYPHILLIPSTSHFSQYRDVMRAVGQVDGVTGVSPFIQQPLMIHTSEGRAMVTARGVDVDRLDDVSDIRKYLDEGELEDLAYDPQRASDERPPIFLGAELARLVGAEVGDVVALVTHLRGTGQALGPSQMAPTSRHFRVAGVFELGYDEFDRRLMLMDLRAMQEFLNRGDVVTGLDVRVADIFQTEAVGRDITSRLTAGGYQALSWQRLYHNLFQSVKIQKQVLSLVMTMIVVVACFNIFSTLFMLVLDKTKEIAILKSMGTTNGGIMRIFMLQGLSIGAIGTAFGLMGGYAICRIIENIDIGLDPKVYKISSLSVDIQLGDFAVIALVAIAISFLTTLYPAWKASQLRPAEGLRFD
jgi:lipoprotein-releasing system permease protein